LTFLDPSEEHGKPISDKLDYPLEGSPGADRGIERSKLRNGLQRERPVSAMLTNPDGQSLKFNGRNRQTGARILCAE
jgi:hypothetical protein